MSKQSIFDQMTLNLQRILTVFVTVTVEGATATDTCFQGLGFSSATLSIAVLMTSMPEGFST